jgi:hypothetical protein
MAPRQGFSCKYGRATNPTCPCLHLLPRHLVSMLLLSLEEWAVSFATIKDPVFAPVLLLRFVAQFRHKEVTFSSASWSNLLHLHIDGTESRQMYRVGIQYHARSRGISFVVNNGRRSQKYELKSAFPPSATSRQACLRRSGARIRN